MHETEKKIDEYRGQNMEINLKNYHQCMQKEVSYSTTRHENKI